MSPLALIERLPSPPELERRGIALAMLDAILSPDWEYRYYSFNRRWNDARSERMASMRNGCGDQYFILFQPGGAILKGFAHESPLAGDKLPVRGVLEGVPPLFSGFLAEPAFEIEATTFCWWNDGHGWRRSAEVSAPALAVDGADALLELLAGAEEDYVRFAEDYFEAEVAAAVVARFFDHEPLTDELAAALNADVDFAALAGDLDEIGYPVAPSGRRRF